MAQLANTYDTFDIKGAREDLANIISNISRDETPFLSNIGKRKVKATKTEWQVDTLAAGSTSNAFVQGDTYGFTDPTPTVRVGNFTQISRKDIRVSGTLEAIDKAGRDSEMSYQTAKKGKELKKDQEAICFANQASLAGSSSVAPLSGGLPTWLTSNVSRGTGGANGGYNTGTGLTVAATDGTARAFTEAQVKAVMQSAFTNGGKPSMIYLSPAQKVAFSAFTGIALNRRDVTKDEQLTLIGAADVYVSDFGKLTTMPCLQNRTRDAFFVDPEFAHLGVLRPYEVVNVAKTGDAENKIMQVEYTLIVDNEAAHGVVADLS